jgi:flagellar biosynthesis protein FlhF
MNVRRYQARDMRDAMRQVREHQGPNAVILSSRRIDGVLEVVAAIDEQQERALHAQDASAAAAGTGTVPISFGFELEAMRRELTDLRTLLVQQRNHSESEQWASRHPLAAELVARLLDCGFSDKLARSLSGGIPEETPVETAWSRLRARLSSAVAVTQPTILDTGGLLALVGPSGVGKTTTLSRLALRQMRRMGRDAVSLVTLDRQRLGAYKQLQTFGEMATLPVMLMETERELCSLASRAGDGHLVLIDTAGQSARDVAQRRLFSRVRAEVDLEIWLVVAATYQSKVLKQVLKAFQQSDPSALVLTKLDEAEQLGEILSVLLEQRLGLAFYSDGQRLTEDFHKIDTAYLISLALGETVSSYRETSWFESADLTSIPSITPRSNATVSHNQGTSENMILESVVPFRKRADAGH